MGGNVEGYDPDLCIMGCGTLVEGDGPVESYGMPVIGNGRYCLDCDRFICSRCNKRAFQQSIDAGVELYDRSLCPRCNERASAVDAAQNIVRSLV